MEFFAGFTFPKAWTSTLILTIPKASSFQDLRPISLCNFCNKVTSKILSARLAAVLPSILSGNQSAFTKGIIIQDNTLLAQELIHSIDN